MSLQDIVNVTISASPRGVTAKNFGIPCVVGQHTVWPELARVYSLATAAADLVTEGFTAGSPIHEAVSSLARAENAPKTVVVGRLTTDYSAQFDLTVKAAGAVQGVKIAFTLWEPNKAVAHPISYTVGASETTTTVAAAIAALMDAVAGITVASVAEVISAEADAANKYWRVTGLNADYLSFEDTTADSSLVTDLTAIETYYSDFYGLILAECPSKARITAIAAHVETQERIFGAVSHDEENGVTGSTTSVAHALNAAGYLRTFLLFSRDQAAHGAATWMARGFGRDPGSSQWAYKALPGVTVDTFTKTFTTELDANKANWYEEVAGLAITQKGTMAGGEWIDAIRGRDWLVARLRERIFGLLANAEKIPYTDAGANQIGSVIGSVLAEGVGKNYLAADPAPVWTVPLVADVADSFKIARRLPDVNFAATLAGAIIAVNITGNLEV